MSPYTAAALVLVSVAVAAGGQQPPCGTSSDPVCVQSCTQVIVQNWDGGYSTDIHLKFSQTVESFSAELVFDRALANLETWASQLSSDDNTTYTLSNNPWDGHHNAGSQETVFVMVTDQDHTAPSTLTSVKLLGQELCTV